MTKKRRKKPGGPRYTAQDYLDEAFNFGGVLTPRREIIRQLEELGGAPGEIAMYLFGLDRRRQLDADGAKEGDG